MATTTLGLPHSATLGISPGIAVFKLAAERTIWIRDKQQSSLFFFFEIRREKSQKMPARALSVTLVEVTITGKHRLAASAFYPPSRAGPAFALPRGGGMQQLNLGSSSTAVCVYACVCAFLSSPSSSSSSSPVLSLVWMGFCFCFSFSSRGRRRSWRW